VISIKRALQTTLAATGSLVAGYAAALQHYKPKSPDHSALDVVIWIITFNELLALASAVVAAIVTWLTFSAAWNVLKLDQVVEALFSDGEVTRELVEDVGERARTEAQLARKRHEEIQESNAGQDAVLAQILANQEEAAATNGVNAETLLMLARRIVDKVDDVEEAERALSSVIDEYLKLRAEAQSGTNLGDEVDEVIRRIFAKVEANDLEGAEEQGRTEFERLKEQAEELKAAQISVAESNLSVARMAYDAPAMADWALERRKLSEGVESLTLDQLRSERGDWYEEGLRLGDRLNMTVAIDLAQRSIARSQTPQDRAICQIELGNALRVQGERSGGEEGLSLLARAVEAFDAALSVYTQKEAPAYWAGTQNNLGGSLKVQGERNGGEEGLSLLARAVAAYEAALTVRTQKEAPGDWAMTQNNLGTALRVQGERSGGEEGLSLLARAVAAHEAALTVRTQKETPAEWAGTQNNLGGALKVQGERNGGEEGLSLLARAVAAYEAALSVFTPKEAPADWAMTTFNMALAEEARGDLSAGPARLERYRAAEDAVLAALNVFDADTMGYYHEEAMQTLTRIREKIAAEPGE